MDTIDNTEAPKRRLEDQAQAETLDWTKPGAPAVAAEQPAPARIPLRAVASMCVNAEGVSVFPTPAAKDLAPGHYMLLAPKSVAALSDEELIPRLILDHDRGINHSHHTHLCEICKGAAPGSAPQSQPQAAAPSESLGFSAADAAQLEQYGAESVISQKNALIKAHQTVLAERDATITDLRAQLARQQAAPAAIPEGWKQVPVESTAVMDNAGRKALRNLLGDTAMAHDAEACYIAMLAAAPAHPAMPAPQQAASSNELPSIDTPEFQSYIGRLINDEFTNYLDFMAEFIAHIDGKISAAVSAPAMPALLDHAHAEPSKQTLIGKLLDDFSQIEHLWGLNEPGALVRQRDVFNLIVAAGKAPAGEVSQGAAPTAADVRDAALEEAAKFVEDYQVVESVTYNDIAFDLRALRRAAQPNIQEAGK